MWVFNIYFVSLFSSFCQTLRLNSFSVHLLSVASTVGKLESIRTHFCIALALDSSTLDLT